MSDKDRIFDKKTFDMFDDFFRRVEGRIKDLSDQVKENVLPDTEEKLRKNVFKSVLISFFAGFLAGIIVMIFGFSRGKKK
jgi:hypothetical protein